LLYFNCFWNLILVKGFISCVFVSVFFLVSVSSLSLHLYFRSESKESVSIIDFFFFLKDNKALGPDGFNVSFFKKTWSIVGLDIINSIRSSLLVGFSSK
jgi:hypothetical protein